MAIGIVKKICIAPEAGEDMQSVQKVEALEDQGLQGDRYAERKGSFNRPASGDGNETVKRQVTLMHSSVFERLGVFKLEDTGRNLEIDGDFELTWLLSEAFRGRECEFDVDEARFRPVAYCDPCLVPNKRAGISKDVAPFNKLYAECGGIIVRVVRGGVIRVGGTVVTPKKKY